MGMIQGDVHEPTDILNLIGQVIDLDRENLNEKGLMDYRWSGEIPEPFAQVERKTWRDVSTLMALNEVEEQFRRQIKASPAAKNRFLFEGVIEPTFNGVITYERARGKDLFTGRHQAGSPGHFKAIMAWLAEVNRYAEVYFTATYTATANLIIALYEHDNKPEDEHSTFQRYFKVNNWNPNPQVTKMLGITANHEPHWGLVICERLIQRFGTVWRVCSAKPEELATIQGVSVTSAKLFLQRIGRTDV